MDIKSKLLETWENNPPNYYFITQPLPSSPSVALSGGGCATDDVENFIKEIQATINKKKGVLWDTQTFGHNEDPKHEWHLVGYDVLDHQVYQKFIVLYYEPINETQIIEDCL